jgi:hypothetical protein
MSWLDKVKKVLATAQNLAPIIGTFVPGAKSVTDAVNKIHLDPERSNDEAVELLAASVESLEARVLSLEKAAKAKK